MLGRPLLHLVPHGTKIHFMRGRFIGLITSAVLSIASLILFFHPGLNLGLDFRGGVVVEAQTQGPADFSKIRMELNQAHISTAGLQQFGTKNNVLIRLDAPKENNAEATQTLINQVKQAVTSAQDGTKIVRADAVGASVSSELFYHGLLALGFSLLMIMIYIWFRFEWEFAVSAIITLLLDLTKAIGFLVITRFEFDLVMVAALLTILGYSTNDKVVVYDRVRENLRKYHSMPIRELIDMSINETLSRTLATSATVFLAALPLALFGGASLSGFAWVMLFGIVVGTSSSIFIAAPLLLFMEEGSLKRKAKKAS
ncbi:protein translocase subunit SecF [Commensalibacter papalotli (ex Botero et al. 2024)]|uniref:protein translocase subunit SecF n=1 Tax=Commensalibacter papalotli (ex Botero et al. 2024) TaxID=2972766 RepID=UPI0022FFB112|nr:protein translocase subunit SecF [Commensalibacter papalotli (ex Botero et al. 2024)]CAI3925603.1 Preprotein translocase subunit SecF (SecF) (PDB:2FYH) (PUBMED:28830929) [Commensalibacter papalotli (ex Botero et al. 2024)]